MSMFERIKSQVMTRHYSKNQERETWTGPICPKIRKRVEKNIELSNNVFADPGGGGLFAVGELVSSQPVDYVVDLAQKTCSCMRWQKTGIPCPHVISCLRHDGIDPLTMVDSCYSLDMHRMAYDNIVYPCKDKSEWERMNGPPIFPPLFTKHVGRPTKNRRKAPGEVDARGGGKIMSRHGVIMHCGYCKMPGHNINGCKWLKAGLDPPNAAAAPNAPPEAEITAEPVVTQEQNPPSNPIQEDLVDRLVQQRPTPRSMEARPIPSSSFISAAQELLNRSSQQSSSTNIRQGELAQRLLQMQQDKNKANEERKIVVLEAKYAAEVKKAEEAAAKKLQNELKKAELAEVKARQAAEKREQRRQDAELTKQAKAETRKFVNEVKKELAEKRKKEALAKKEAEKQAKREAAMRKIEEKKQALARKELEMQAQREAQRETHRAQVAANAARHVAANEVQREAAVVPQKKVNMFDEFRNPRN